MNKVVDAALGVKLEAIQSLAQFARTALPLGMSKLSVGPDGVLVISGAPKSARVKFFVDQLQFNVAVSPEAEQALLQIWADVGYVPYTAQSPERRRAVLEVLRASQGLPRARFVVENGQKILVLSETRIPDPAEPELLIYEAVQLVQEARPYLRLLAEFLRG